MPHEITVYACLALGLSSALVGGVFQSFSDFVMRALVASRPAAGAEAMQQINRTVFRSAFLVMLLGLAPVTLAFAAYAWLALTPVLQIWISAGAGVYFVGVFLVTMFGNVPMNKRLESMAYGQPETDAYWRTYGAVWTRWNHVRTLSSIIAAACFLIAGVAAA